MRASILFAFAITLTGALAAPAEARADIEIAADFNVGVPRVPKPSFSTGTGFDARIGKEFTLGAARFTLEACGGYVELGSTLVRGLAGLRFGVVSPVSPSLFLHVGYGAIAYDGDFGSGPTSGLLHGTAFDAGFALDLRPLSLFGAGIHLIYNGVQVNTDDPSLRATFGRAHWISLGAHAGIYF